MAQVFQCKKYGCKKNVVYVPNSLPAFYKSSPSKSKIQRNKGSKTVYLTCDRGHCYPYIVSE